LAVFVHSGVPEGQGAKISIYVPKRFHTKFKRNRNDSYREEVKDILEITDGRHSVEIKIVVCSYPTSP
jgi:hypothetical protein